MIETVTDMWQQNRLVKKKRLVVGKNSCIHQIYLLNWERLGLKGRSLDIHSKPPKCPPRLSQKTYNALKYFHLSQSDRVSCIKESKRVSLSCYGATDQKKGHFVSSSSCSSSSVDPPQLSRGLRSGGTHGLILCHRFGGQIMWDALPWRSPSETCRKAILFSDLIKTFTPE